MLSKCIVLALSSYYVGVYPILCEATVQLEAPVPLTGSVLAVEKKIADEQKQ
jgi:hypothetical protein